MIVFGKNVAKELINNNIKINKVYLSKNFDDKGILNFIENNNIRKTIMDKKDMDYKYKGNHQGIVLEIEDYKYSKLDSTYNDNFVVILDHLEDPHNFGAIIRTCEAAGVDGIIIPKNRSVEVTSTVMRTSVGALDYVKIARVTNLTETMNYLKKQGFWIVGTDMDGEDYQEIDYRGKTVLVIGNEGSGMSRLVKENCDFIASIPMNGHVNSLNASVAAGIVIYEAISKRK